MNLISFSIAKTGQRSGGMVWNDTCRQGEWTYHHVCFSPSPLPFHFMSALPSPDFQQGLYPSCLHFHHVFFQQVLYRFMSAFSSRVFQQVLHRFMSAFSSRVFHQDHYSFTSASPLYFPSNPLQFAIICCSAGPSPFHVLCSRSPLFTKAFAVFRQIHNRSVLLRHRLFLLASPLSVHVC